MTAIPSLRDFHQLMTCSVYRARSFVRKYGVYWEDKLNEGTAAHWAAMNSNLQVLNEIVRKDFDLFFRRDKFGLMPIWAICKTKHCAPVRYVFFAGWEIAVRENRPFGIEDVFRLGFEKMVKEFDRDKYRDLLDIRPVLACGAAALSNIEMLEKAFDKELVLQDFKYYFIEALHAAIASGERGLKAIQFLFQIKHPQFETSIVQNLHAKKFYSSLLWRHEGYDTHVRSITTLIESAPNFDCSYYIQNNEELDWSISGRMFCILHLATRGEYCLAALAGGRFVMQDFDKKCNVWAFRIVRNRAIEFCLALSELPALLLCEIGQAYCAMWPRVKFHHYWRLATTIKQ